MRLIDGDALIDKYGEWYVEDLTNYLEIGYIGTIKRIVDSMPTIEPKRAIKDCRNCKHGNYNDHWDTYFCYYSGDCNDWDKWEPSAEPEPCEFCRNRGLEDGDTLYISADWDGGIGFDYIRDIHYCPRCGRRLQMWKEIING